ncbi:MAG TPA: DUF2171 domain-containing protein [Chloroflexota bacterium]|nr:DUF2171 domain-containing protein [Chloroflexota bacterium]
MLDHQTFDTTAAWQITDGMTVYASDGNKVGTVQNYAPNVGYIDARKGWLFTKDFYVPLSDIDTVTEDAVTLKLTMDALADDRYSIPPVPTAANSDPVTLADGSIMDPVAGKQPYEEAEAEDAYQSSVRPKD